MAKYLSSTEQTEWHKEPKLLGEREGETDGDEQQQIHDMEGFNQNTGISSPTKREQRRSNTSYIPRRKEMEESRAENVLTEERSINTPKR